MKNRAEAFEHYLAKNNFDDNYRPTITLPELWKELSKQGYKCDKGKNIFQIIGNDSIYKFFAGYTSINAKRGPKY